jgi:dolichol-phosphate mannosyltransferase
MISIVIPTRNEEQNIGALLKCLPYLSRVGIKYEAVVVDDSDDDTPRIASLLGARVIKGRRKGLGQAIIDGINVSNGEIVVVMDADLSHPYCEIPNLIAPLKDGYDMVVGSRYTVGGKVVGWELGRRIISRCACLLALPVTTIKDSTSGFFAINKSLLEGVKLEGKSWKIMLEILIKAKPVRVKEISITFVVRTSGKSKFNSKQMVAYLKHLASLVLYKYNRFLKFCIVGGTGALITFSVTWLLTEQFGMWYMMSMVIAVAIATVTNFTLNSIWTFSIGKNMDDADYEWNAYYKGNVVQKWWKHRIAEAVVDMIPEPRKGLSVLDIGCGSSPMSIQIGTPNYIGIDSNPKKIKYMQSKLPYYRYECARDFQNGQKHDVVISLEVIEHLESMDSVGEFLSFISNASKFGGSVIIATPDYNKILWRVIEKVYGKLMPSAYAYDHKVRFSENSLVDCCAKYGLKHIETSRVLGCDMVCKFIKEKHETV